MYYFPQRQIDKRGYYHRRTWNAEIPHYDEAVLHWCADTCFEDLAGTEPCEPGSTIYHVSNKTDYPGLDALAVGDPLYQFVIDGGFPSIYRPSGNVNGRTLRAATPYALAMQIAVYRCATEGWGGYGAILGSFDQGWFPIMTDNGGYGWYRPPSTVQRRNGVSSTPGSNIISTGTPSCIAWGHNTPSSQIIWQVGCISDGYETYSFGIYLYEVLGYSSYLTTEKIEDIEAHLMDKYGIIA